MKTTREINPMSKEKTVEVPVKWIESLMKLVEAVESHEDIIANNKEEVEQIWGKRLSELNRLIGFASSAKYLLTQQNEK